MEIETIGVVGAGQMGTGIAQVASVSRLNVIMSDLTDELVKKGVAIIGKNLDRSVQKEKITPQDREQLMARIRGTTRLDDMVMADLVIEAATEKEPVKLEIFKNLEEFCRKEVILATNTSSISITKIASATRRPDRVIGMHFMNPVPLMKLVEIIRGLATSEETFQTVRDLSETMGKIPMEARDFPGFISNRILMPMINEAIYALFEGVGSVEAIDGVMKLGMNHPMGPLALADLIGLDTCLAIMEVLYRGFGDSKYRPCPLLRTYVDAGYLGRKTGRGFYTYE
jgi:3-hydroxybutyryl-CoA dehydrogenase